MKIEWRISKDTQYDTQYDSMTFWASVIFLANGGTLSELELRVLYRLKLQVDI